LLGLLRRPNLQAGDRTSKGRNVAAIESKNSNRQQKESPYHGRGFKHLKGTDD